MSPAPLPALADRRAMNKAANAEPATRTPSGIPADASLPVISVASSAPAVPPAASPRLPIPAENAIPAISERSIPVAACGVSGTRSRPSIVEWSDGGSLEIIPNVPRAARAASAGGLRSCRTGHRHADEGDRVRSPWSRSMPAGRPSRPGRPPRAAGLRGTMTSTHPQTRCIKTHPEAASGDTDRARLREGERRW
jgi:hypothetical protein